MIITPPPRQFSGDLTASGMNNPRNLSQKPPVPGNTAVMLQGGTPMAVQYHHRGLTTDIGRRRVGTSSQKSLMKSGGARTNPELAVDHYQSFDQDLFSIFIMPYG